MKFNERKLHFIEDYLKVSDVKLMNELENVLRKRKAKVRATSTFKQFSGIISKSEAKELEKIIASGCEKIDSNDWK